MGIDAQGLQRRRARVRRASTGSRTRSSTTARARRRPLRRHRLPRDVLRRREWPASSTGSRAPVDDADELDDGIERALARGVRASSLAVARRRGARARGAGARRASSGRPRPSSRRSSSARSATRRSTSRTRRSRGRMKAFIREPDRGRRHEERDQGAARRRVRRAACSPCRRGSGFDLLAWVLPLAGLAVAALVVGSLAWRWSRSRATAEPGDERERAAARPGARAAARRGARPLRGHEWQRLPASPIAFVAGLVSVLAPCVLPLVPGYLSAVSAVEAGPARASRARRGASSSRACPFFAGLHRVSSSSSAPARRRSGSRSLGTSSCRADRRVPADRLRARLHGPAAAAGAARRRRARPGRAPERLERPPRRRRSPSARRRASAPCSARSSCSPATRARCSRARAARRLLARARRPRSCSRRRCSRRAMGVFRWMRDHYAAIRPSAARRSSPSALLLFFDRFWWLRVYLNRALRAPSASARRAAGAASSEPGLDDRRRRRDRREHAPTSTPRAPARRARAGAAPSRAGARSRRGCRGRPGTRRRRRGRGPGRSRARRRRRAPRELELLVRREVRASADQLEPGLSLMTGVLVSTPDGARLGAWRRSCWRGSISSSGEARGAAPRSPPGHDRQHRCARSRDRRHRADRPRRGRRRVARRPDPRLHEPHRHDGPPARPRRGLRPGDRQVRARRARARARRPS